MATCVVASIIMHVRPVWQMKLSFPEWFILLNIYDATKVMLARVHPQFPYMRHKIQTKDLFDLFNRNDYEDFTN